MLPETATTVSTINVGRQPSGVAVADGIVWITDRGDNLVTRYDARSGSSTNIAVGAAPIGIAVGEDAVWVANSDDGTVSKIDPVSREVVKNDRGRRAVRWACSSPTGASGSASRRRQ